jgi:rare lipoprotein A
MIQNGTAPVKLILLNTNSPLPANIKVPHYTVQIGSFANMQDAMKFGEDITDSKIVEVTLNGRAFYRVYVGLYKEKSEAETMRKYLYAKGYDGFVKQFENN